MKKINDINNIDEDLDIDVLEAEINYLSKVNTIEVDVDYVESDDNTSIEKSISGGFDVSDYDKADDDNIKKFDEMLKSVTKRDYKTIIQETTKITDVYFSAYDFKNSFIYQKGASGDKLFFHQIKSKSFLKYLFDYYKKIVISFRKRKSHYDNIKIAHENLIFRVNKIITDSGYIYACRNIDQSFIPIEESGLSKRQLNEILHKRLNKGGLILVCGSPGNGKSTTAAGIIVKRLQKYGGFCISIEDPIEFPIQGCHGDGFCIQVPVIDDFATEIKHSMRSYPSADNNILFIGEIRDAESALAAIKSSIDGRLVIATMHTDSIQNTFARIASMVGKEMPEAVSLLAESFRVVIHQKLMKIGPNISLQADVLVNTKEAYASVRNNRFSHLVGELENQKRKLKTEDQTIEYNDIIWFVLKVKKEQLYALFFVKNKRLNVSKLCGIFYI